MIIKKIKLSKKNIMQKITLLGTGLVGSAIAIDLSRNFDVTAADINKAALEKLTKYGIKTVETDLSVENNVRELIASADIVVGAVPGFMGFKTLKTIIEAKKNVVDISFFPEDPFELDQLAKQNNVTAVIDCGVAPGFCNTILGYHSEKMKVSDYVCLVGGLPEERKWPFEYKAVFSPIDVIEEYIRPARYVQSGELVVREALSDTEIINFKNIGSLESWNSDGLRTLAVTMKGIPNMIEKTLRYPGTVEYLRVIRDCGFFSYDEIDVKGQKIRPIDLTSKLLFPKWKMEEGDRDFTIMRVTVKGEEKGKQKTYIYDLLDKFSSETNTISMARTTGYTCTAAVNLISETGFNHVGICPPEYLGKSENDFKFMISYLKERNVIYEVTER